MFKYVKFNKVKTEYTVLQFRGGNEGVKVNHFDVDVVSIEADIEADIDALIAIQPVEIGCEVIGYDEFRTLVVDSAQLNRIRQRVKEKIALRYDSGDETAMSKKAVDDVKRVAYDEYIDECLELGNELKSGIGYLSL